MRHRIVALLIASAGLACLAFLVAVLGLVTIERHTGFFAPVWDEDGDGLYYFQRDTHGLTWGMGWEHFSPPAYSYVFQDIYRLQHLELGAAEPVTLGLWSGSPVQGRITRNYRGRVFNTVSVRVEPRSAGAAYLVDLSIPQVPSSENWSLQGEWSQEAGASGDWMQAWAGYTPRPDEVLVNGVELLVVPGEESFPAAILAVKDDGQYEVLARNRSFGELYPDGVPDRTIFETSIREQIKGAREFRQVRTDLIARHEAAGLSEGAAILKANREMEELGYLPKRPRMVATRLHQIPSDLRVFTIPPAYFEAGLFQDIAAAIAAPGTEVDASTGTYLNYGEDDLGSEMKDWRDQGHERFVVETSGQAYLIAIQTP